MGPLRGIDKMFDVTFIGGGVLVGAIVSLSVGIWIPISWWVIPVMLGGGFIGHLWYTKL